MNTVAQHDHSNMTCAEWQIRCDLAALYRICDQWLDRLDQHSPVRARAR